eukprot:jgi/Chrpa1/19395/Chrysochromulina_OHIO_Genome00003172-RA
MRAAIATGQRTGTGVLRPARHVVTASTTLTVAWRSRDTLDITSASRPSIMPFAGATVPVPGTVSRREERAYAAYMGTSRAQASRRCRQRLSRCAIADATSRVRSACRRSASSSEASCAFSAPKTRAAPRWATTG